MPESDSTGHSEDHAMARTRNAERRRYWQEAIGRQQASGQSIVGFCAEEGPASRTQLYGAEFASDSVPRCLQFA